MERSKPRESESSLDSRHRDDEFIYFNPMGVAVEDLAVANAVFKKALTLDAGEWFEINPESCGSEGKK